jgi:phosphatidylglycerophosphate synthase
MQKKTNTFKKIMLYRLKSDLTFEAFRDKFLMQPATFVYSLGITPNALSIVGIFIIIIAMFLLKYPILAAFLILLNLFIDGLDGVVARRHNLKSFAGSIIDTTCDTLGSVITIIGFSLFYNIELAAMILWIMSVLIYSLITALHSIKVSERSKVLGFRNFINVGAIVLLISISVGNLTHNEISAIINTYMQYIAIALIALSLYALTRLMIVLWDD